MLLRSISFKRGFTPRDGFPAKELAALFLPQFASAVAVTNLFPYVGYMIVDLHMSQSIETAGYYAGFIASAMMLGRFASSMFWGRISDHYGRKPVLCVCCLSIAIFSLAFGFSNSFWVAVVSRFLLGFFNPIVGLARTCVSEVCAKKYESYGMGSTTGSWYIGLTLGPLLGSMLARPCMLYPALQCTSGSHIFERFPYLLPNLVSSALGWVSLLVVLLAFPETLPSQPSQQLARSSDATSSHSAGSLSALWGIDGLVRTCAAYFVLAPLPMTFDEVFPLWAMSGADVGGLQFDVRSVGAVISSTGLLLSVYVMFVYPLLANRLGPRGCFAVGQLLSGPLFFIVSLVRTMHVPASQQYLFLSSVVGTTKMCTGLALCGISIEINGLVDSSLRGSLNGLVVTLDSIAKMLGLAMGPVVYAWSVSTRVPYLDFHFVFAALFVGSYLSLAVFEAPRVWKCMGFKLCAGSQKSDDIMNSVIASVRRRGAGWLRLKASLSAGSRAGSGAQGQQYSALPLTEEAGDKDVGCVELVGLEDKA